MEHAMQTMMRTTLLVLALVPWGTESTLAQPYPSGPPPAGGPPPASGPPLAGNPPSQSGQYSSNEVLDAGHRFFGTISRGLGEIVEKAAANGACPTDMSWGRRPAAPGSPACVTGRACCSPRMPATVGSTGKGPLSVSLLAATA